MIIRQLTDNDIPALAPLHALCFGDERWSEEQLRGSLSLATTFGAAAWGDDALLGFYLVQATSDEMEILTICVDPAHRHRGIGQKLLGDLTVRQKKGCVFLDVAEDNQAARHLYEKHGFVLYGRRPAYYDRKCVKIDALNYRYLVNDSA